MSAPLFSAPYKVRAHEHIDDEFARVILRCLGFPSKGTQPEEWPFVLKVPVADLQKWPLGSIVRMAVAS